MFQTFISTEVKFLHSGNLCRSYSPRTLSFFTTKVAKTGETKYSINVQYEFDKGTPELLSLFPGSGECRASSLGPLMSPAGWGEWSTSSGPASSSFGGGGQLGLRLP